MTEFKRNEALVILTGITATRNKKSYVLNYFKSNSRYEVFLPKICQYLGVRSDAKQLCNFLQKHHLENYHRCHFICYISGGFILRCALQSYQMTNIGRIIYVRSPFQERVPELTIHKYGRLTAMIIHGKMLFDLASDWVNELPQIHAETGFIIEKGISAIGIELGLKPSDFETYAANVNYSISLAKNVFTYPLSHDEVYTDDQLLKQIASFIEVGHFF